MSGRDAQRGFIFQSIIAMIECLDRDDWDEVKLEPITELDKVDIQLYCDSTVVSAIQVKSSINQFERYNVNRWLEELKKDAPSAEKILLYLVGDSFSAKCDEYVSQNSDQIRKISFNLLKEICTGKLVEYVKKSTPGEDVRLKDLDCIDAGLFSKIHRNSTAHERLSRDAFKEVFCSIFTIRLYDSLMNIFSNDRKTHPSIRMMNPDPLLFPKGLPEIWSDVRYAVKDKEDPQEIPIQDMILESWKSNDRSHILLIGEGGIGKTVSMLTLPEEEWFKKLGIPVIYIPLQRLDEGDLDRYLKGKIGSDNYERSQELANRIREGHPELLLLLDGFNEIPDQYKRKAEKKIREWMEKPGIQIITTSRMGFSLENHFSRYRLQPLPYETVRSFLLSAGIKEERLPGENDRVWKVINVPLMLAMYTQIKKVKEEASYSSAASILEWKEPDNAAHIIWDYLQMELCRSIERDDTSHSAIEYAVALFVVAPYICCKMSYRRKFYLKQEEFIKIIQEAMVFYSSHQILLDSQVQNVITEFDPYCEQDLFREIKTPEYGRILIKNLALFQKQKIRRTDNNNRSVIDYSYSLMHQNFRDALAAFFICSCLLKTSGSEERKEFLHYADYYVKNYMAEHLSDQEILSIWNQHREEEPEDGETTFILLDLIGRQRDYDYRELDFSGIDLTKTNLHSLFMRRMDICPLPRNRNNLSGTKISIDCLSPNGHTGGIRSVAFSSNGRYLASSADDKTVRIWNLESGESRVLKGNGRMAYSLAYSPDGRYLASGANDSIVQFWDLESEECRILEGHASHSWVNSVAFSADGKSLASGSSDRTVRIWNLENDISYRLESHIDQVNSVAFSSDGKHIASGSSDRTVRIWNLESGEYRVLEGHTGIINSIAYSPDSTHLSIVADDKTVRIWDLESGEYRVLQGHTGRINSIAYSPDARFLASGADDKMVRIWNLESEECRVLQGHTGSVNSIAYSPDGRHLASGADDRTIRIWDLESEECRVLEGQADHSGVNSLAFSPDGSSLACGADDRTVRVWDLKNGGYCVLEGHTGEVLCVAYSPNGRRLASGADDRTVRVWDLKSGGCYVLQGHEAKVNNVAFSQDGMQLASSADDRNVRIWDIRERECPIPKEHTIVGSSVAYSPDGRHLASGADDRIVRIWNLKGEVCHVLKGHTGRVRSVNYSLGGEFLASCADDRTVRVWNLESLQSQSLEGHADVVNSAVYSPDGWYLASGSNDKTVRIWNVQSDAYHILEGHTDKVFSIVYSPDGKYLASSSSDKTVRIFDLTSGEHQVLKGHSDTVNSVVYSPDGRYLASGSDDRTVRIWNLKSGICCILGDHKCKVNSLAYSPDGWHLASGADDGKVRIWNLKNGKSHTLEGHEGMIYSVEYSPDGMFLASGADDGKVRIWNLKSGICCVLDDHVCRVNSVNSLAYSPDGRYLASGSDDRTVRIWNLKSGICCILGDHKCKVNSLAYSPDGRYLASFADDGTVRIWNLRRGEYRVIKEQGHADLGSSVAFSPNGRHLAVSKDDGTVRIWTIKSGEFRVLKDHAGNVKDVAYSPDGRFLASSADDWTVYFWETRDYREIGKLFIISHLNLSGANFELAVIDEKDKKILKAAGARV